MATSKASHFDLEWWVIQKRAVYLGVLVLILALIAGGMAVYVWRYGNPLKKVAMKSEARAERDSCRLRVTFESFARRPGK